MLSSKNQPAHAVSSARRAVGAAAILRGGSEGTMMAIRRQRAVSR